MQCTLSRALAVTPPRPFLLLGAGTYQTGNLTITGTRHLIGDGAPRPEITNIASGPILIIEGPGSEVTIENLRLAGATTGTNGDGNAIELASGSAQVLRVVRSELSNNAGSGISGGGASVTVIESLLMNNGDDGVELIDCRADIDRTIAIGNKTGFFLDSGSYTVTNSFAVRNTDRGIDIFPSQPSVIEFNTVVDNAIGISCIGGGGAMGTFPNNLIARNGKNLEGSVCTYPSSVIIGDQISDLKFVSPDAAPFDYHIRAGSSAVGAAEPSTTDHDFDGDPRPATGADVGADQLP